MKTIVTLVLFAIAFTSHAQFEINDEESQANLGFGLGISYGGIGARMSFLPVKHLALFAAAGYNLDGFGYNVGAEARLLPGKRVVPVLMAMYGYNAVIVVQGAEYHNNTYYGPTVGGGVEIHSRNGQNFVAIELLAPFRSQDFHDHLNILKNDPNIEITGPWPVAFSFGYHMKF